ncbi:hypothetical protein UPYG_G00141250 [Umbra pygmaea]|uniref:E3 ubiquitin/ISG15 ligase TRIM25-like n=1 Tax=Umbra pygmaea TaxID=75934 RepID=A0ABD0WVD7_UMBPY
MAVVTGATSCFICLDLLKDPVTIPCGHSYCMDCIKGSFDQEDDKGIYSCPQCEQTFPSNLAENTILLNQKKRKGAPSYNFAGPGDVECDFCTGRKRKAVKSCLVCLVSFCETHLQPHHEIIQLRRHKLVKASKKLQERICSQHDKLLEVYCRTDQQCICYLCTVDEHKGHDTVSAVAERTEKQKLLGEKYRQSEERILEKENKIQALKQAMDFLKRSAQAAVESSEKIFTELIHLFTNKCFELKELIRAQEKAEVSRAEGLLEQLEQEVSELRRKDVELKEVSQTEDHIQFLQSFQSLCVSLGSDVLPSSTVYSLVSFEHVNTSVTKLQDELQHICMKEMEQMFVEVSTNEMNLVTTDGMGPDYSEPNMESSTLTTVETKQPKTRKDFLTYSCKLTLDPNTANQYLCLSEGNRKVGVYLDHRAGTLSFYSISDKMTLLHKIETTFTRPLYPGFFVETGYVKILTPIQGESKE